MILNEWVEHDLLLGRNQTRVDLHFSLEKNVAVITMHGKKKEDIVHRENNST